VSEPLVITRPIRLVELPGEERSAASLRRALTARPLPPRPEAAVLVGAALGLLLGMYISGGRRS
jgi:hypothetical protein